MLDLEDAVKSIGGKTSQELGKYSGLNTDNLLNRLTQLLVNTAAGVLATFSIVYASNQGVQRPEIVGAILGGLLITPTVPTGSLALSRCMDKATNNKELDNFLSDDYEKVQPSAPLEELLTSYEESCHNSLGYV